MNLTQRAQRPRHPAAAGVAEPRHAVQGRPALGPVQALPPRGGGLADPGMEQDRPVGRVVEKRNRDAVEVDDDGPRRRFRRREPAFRKRNRHARAGGGTDAPQAGKIAKNEKNGEKKD